MIDWLGARRPLEVILLMTLLLAVAALGAQHLLIPAIESLFHAQSR